MFHISLHFLSISSSITSAINANAGIALLPDPSCPSEICVETERIKRDSKMVRPRLSRKRGRPQAENVSASDYSTKKDSPIFVKAVCKACRKDRKIRGRSVRQQSTISAFLFSSHSSLHASGKTANESCVASNELNESALDKGGSGLNCGDDLLLCSVCRRVLAEPPAAAAAAAAAAASPDSAAMAAAARRPATGSGCPAIAKLRGYQRTARDKGVAWALSDAEALAMMTRPCTFCGRAAASNPGGFNGINRLDHSVPPPCRLRLSAASCARRRAFLSRARGGGTVDRTVGAGAGSALHAACTARHPRVGIAPRTCLLATRGTSRVTVTTM